MAVRAVNADLDLRKMSLNQTRVLYGIRVTKVSGRPDGFNDKGFYYHVESLEKPVTRRQAVQQLVNRGNADEDD